MLLIVAPDFALAPLVLDLALAFGRQDLLVVGKGGEELLEEILAREK